MPSTRIYLDYHATTPVDPRVVEVVVQHMRETIGNPSSSDHVFGDDAAAVVDRAAADVSNLVSAEPSRVVFTAGATEAINLALQGFANWAWRRSSRPVRLAVSAVEHSAVLETAHALERAGRAALHFVPVERSGRVDLDALRRCVAGGVDLVAVMAANHEVGTIQPIADVGAIAASAGAAFLCDATQAIGKVALDMRMAGISFLALSAHKIYGPKGVGALVLGDVAPVEAVTFGGGQQRGLRPGTLNVPGIAGLGEALRLRRVEGDADEARIAALRDALQSELCALVPGLVVNGDARNRLAGNLHVSIAGVPNQAVIARVRDQLAISTGSACTSGIEAPSHVLRAMALPQPLLDGALRFGLGKFTSRSDVESAASLVAAAVSDVRTRL